MKKLFLFLLIILYFLAGINHFWHPQSYVSIIPPYLPAHGLINYAAGAAEMILAVLMLFSSTRKTAAYGIIAMLLAFVPTHIYMIEKAPFQLGAITVTSTIAWIRLVLLQPILIIWVWWLRQ